MLLIYQGILPSYKYYRIAFSSPSAERSFGMADEMMQDGNNVTTYRRTGTKRAPYPRLFIHGLRCFNPMRFEDRRRGETPLARWRFMFETMAFGAMLVQHIKRTLDVLRRNIPVLCHLIPLSSLPILRNDLYRLRCCSHLVLGKSK